MVTTSRFESACVGRGCSSVATIQVWDEWGRYGWRACTIHTQEVSMRVAQRSAKDGLPTIMAAADWGTNGHLIAALARLGILQPDDRILDPTYGKGVWWKQWTPNHLVTHTHVDGFDFRALPYEDESFDVIAFDPPYVLHGGRETTTMPEFNDRFGLTTAPKTYAELMDLHYGGLDEAWRCVAPARRVRRNGKLVDQGGLVLFKTAFYVWSSKVHPGALDGVTYARQLGFDVDYVMEHVEPSPRAQPERTRKDGFPSVQESPRNNVSYLFVLRKRTGGPRFPLPLPSPVNVPEPAQQEIFDLPGL